MNEDKLTPEEFTIRCVTAEAELRQTVHMFQDTDGNWRGGYKKGEKYVFVRAEGPETVLQLLLTHDGK